MLLRSSVAALTLVTIGCAAPASQSAQLAGAPSRTASASFDPARCAAIADSTGRLPERSLRLLIPTTSPRLTVIPRDSRSVQIDYRVTPGGEFDAPSLRITGSSDVSFRNEVTQVLSATRFKPAMVGGCPAWGRSEIRIKTQTRRM